MERLFSQVSRMRRGNLEFLTERSIPPTPSFRGLFVSLCYKNQIFISACVTSILQFPTVKFEIEK